MCCCNPLCHQYEYWNPWLAMYCQDTRFSSLNNSTEIFLRQQATRIITTFYSSSSNNILEAQWSYPLDNLWTPYKLQQCVEHPYITEQPRSWCFLLMSYSLMFSWCDVMGPDVWAVVRGVNFDLEKLYLCLTKKKQKTINLKKKKIKNSLCCASNFLTANVKLKLFVCTSSDKSNLNTVESVSFKKNFFSCVFSNYLFPLELQYKKAKRQQSTDLILAMNDLTAQKLCFMAMW